MAVKFGRTGETRARLTPVETKPHAAAKHLDLTIRPRRNRKAEWSRRLVAENVLTVDDLIWPLFVCEGEKRREPVASMPGVERYSVDEIVRIAERAMKLKIPALALFPNTDPKLRDERGSEALNPDNLVCRALSAIKREFPELGLAADVALDPYTSHGHDGLLGRRKDSERRDRGRAGGAGARAGRCRLRRDRALRHDGRPRRRHPQGPRCRRPSRRADPRLHGEIRLGLLRPVPRRGRHQYDIGRRQAHLSDGFRQRRRGAARGHCSTSRKAPTC